jgi:hypothetical protein
VDFSPQSLQILVFKKWAFAANLTVIAISWIPFGTARRFTRINKLKGGEIVD